MVTVTLNKKRVFSAGTQERVAQDGVDPTVYNFTIYPLHVQAPSAQVLSVGRLAHEINSLLGKNQKFFIPVCEFCKIELNVKVYKLVSNCTATVHHIQYREKIPRRQDVGVQKRR